MRPMSARPNGTNSSPGWAPLVAVAVHHDNLGLVRVICPPEPVGGQRAAGSPAQDHDSLHKIIFVNGGWPGERHSSCAWVTNLISSRSPRDIPPRGFLGKPISWSRCRSAVDPGWWAEWRHDGQQRMG